MSRVLIREVMIVRNMFNPVLFGLVVFAATAIFPESASALTLNTSLYTPGAATVYIGVTGSPARVRACINDTDLVPLMAGTALTEDLIIRASSASDYIIFKRGAPGAAPSNSDCGQATWSPVTFAGYRTEIDLYGAGTNNYNYFTGPSGAPDIIARGGADRDWFYVYSSTGTFVGDSGNDDFVMSITSTSGTLSGGAGTDCFGLVSGTYGGTLDCGTGIDRHNRVASGRPASCEASGYDAFPGCGFI